MATEAPVNGNGHYAPHSGYGALDQQQHNNYGYAGNSSTPSQAVSAQPPPPTSSTPAAATSSAPPQSDVPKDEVGWYFVEQYYTTLSRSPEKLYLFYNKRSQFVSGQETDKVSVCVGQKAINDRIKDLDFHDCKVRVTNVDSQSSDSNIVIQVIGEISNRSQPHKKFTQTFVLATQPTGYFVLNDIFRYLIDEEDEPEQVAETGEEEAQAVELSDSGYQEPAPTAGDGEPKGLTSSADPAAVEQDTTQVDREIESRVPADELVEVDEPKTNGTPAEEAEDKEEEVAAIPETVEEPAAEEVPTPAVEEEKPEVEKEASEEPAATPPAPVQAPPQPAPAPKPAAPKTWASLAASANRVATPATPSTASSATSQPKPAPKATPSAPAAAATPSPAAAPAAAPSAPAAQRDASPADNSQGEEWTAVPSSHNRNQSRQANAQPEPTLYRGYVSKVFPNIDGAELRNRLATFGEVLYFDVAQQKVRPSTLSPHDQRLSY